MQRKTRDIAFPMDGEVISDSSSYEIDESLKVEQGKPEVWDLLGHPSGKFDYKVRYNAPSIAHVLLKDIVLSGWGEEFDKEDDKAIRIVQPLNLQVMGIDI